MALRFIATLGKPRFFLTLTCHERQRWMVYACATAYLRFRPGNRDAPDDTIHQQARNAVETLCNNHDDSTAKWEGMSALDLAERFPAV
eukprot:5702498-Amphidinium_carterae.1